MLPPGMPALGGMAPHKDGLAVYGVTEGSVMDRLGLRKGDVLMSVDGQPVGMLTDVDKVVAPFFRGKSAQAHVLRDGQVVLMTMKLAARDPAAEAQSAKAFATLLKEEGIVPPEVGPQPSNPRR